MTELIELLRTSQSDLDRIIKNRQHADSHIENASGTELFPEFSKGGGSSNPGVNCTGGCRG